MASTKKVNENKNLRTNIEEQRYEIITFQFCHLHGVEYLANVGNKRINLTNFCSSRFKNTKQNWLKKEVTGLKKQDRIIFFQKYEFRLLWLDYTFRKSF